MNYNIAALLSEAFRNTGMPDVVDANLDNHSTITINMKDEVPDINIKYEENNDEFWIWSVISEFVPESLSYLSSNLIPVMLNHHEHFFYAGQPCLYPVDGNLQLRAQIKEKNLNSSDDFLLLLDQFLTILQDYRFVMR